MLAKEMKNPFVEDSSPNHLSKYSCSLLCFFRLETNLNVIYLFQEYCMSEYLRMSGVYWGLTVMDLMGQLHHMNKEEILAFIKSCQHECGGISASIGHDPHLLYTLSAVQVNRYIIYIDSLVALP